VIWYVGDVHGDGRALARVDAAASLAGVTVVVQVGDLGILWKPDGVRPYFDKRARKGRPGPTWYTCGGNHEHYANWLALPETRPTTELAPGCLWVHRGEVIELDGRRHLFMGGADSVDRAVRIEGISWWPQEIPTREEWERFADSYRTGPDVVVSHDAPLVVSLPYSRRDREGGIPHTFSRIQGLFRGGVREPALWVFGHHHVLDRWDVGRTTFLCCGQGGDYATSDLALIPHPVPGPYHS